MADSAKGHEGNRIRQLLADADKRPSDLARAAGVTQTSVGRYLVAEKLGAKAWETASRGLLTLNIDPRQIRPASSVPLRMRESPDDLRGLLVGFQRKHLEALKTILEASPEAQYVLRVVIQDRLETDRS
jgi:hypothetical protein